MKAPKIKTTLLVLSVLISITKTTELSDLCQEGNIDYGKEETNLKPINKTIGTKTGTQELQPVTWNFLIHIYKYEDDSFIVLEKIMENDLKNNKNALEMMNNVESDYRFQGYKKEECIFKKTSIFKKTLSTYFLKYPIDHFEENLLTNKDQLKDKIFWQIETMYKIAKILETYHEKRLVHNKLTPEIFSLLNIYTPIIEDLTASTEFDTPITSIEGFLPFVSPQYQIIHDITSNYFLEQSNMEEEEEEKFVISSPKNDIYSLAGIFYYILTGKGGNWEFEYDEDLEFEDLDFRDIPGVITKNDEGYLLYDFELNEENNHFQNLLQKMSICEEESRFNITEVIEEILVCLVNQVRKDSDGIAKLQEYLNNEETFLNNMEDKLNSKAKIREEFLKMKNIFLERVSVIQNLRIV